VAEAGPEVIGAQPTILFPDKIGPRDKTTAWEGMYAERANGIDTIKRIEKLSNPASVFTPSAMAGISRSHEANRFWISSLGRNVSPKRTANANRGNPSVDRKLS
jgi:hypothetical protein